MFELPMQTAQKRRSTPAWPLGPGRKMLVSHRGRPRRSELALPAWAMVRVIYGLKSTVHNSMCKLVEGLRHAEQRETLPNLVCQTDPT